MDAREQIAALREQLRYHNEKYYNEDAPEITDYEYDMMQRELRAHEAEHPELADHGHGFLYSDGSAKICPVEIASDPAGKIL